MAQHEDKGREPFHWRSALAYKSQERIVVRGFDVNELAGNLDFGELIYLLWKGELPTKEQGKMVNALLTIGAEHAFSPSTAAARFVASGGNPLNVSAAAGVLAMGDLHGSPDRLARILQEGVGRMGVEGKDVAEVAREIVFDFRGRGERMPGFHQPQHIKDPRPPRLVQLAREYGVVGDHLRLALAMQDNMRAAYGRALWLNISGAVGAIASDLGFPHTIIRGFMLVSRLASAVAHAWEEADREAGWRASAGQDITQPLDLSLQGKRYYDGPEDRALPPERRQVEVPPQVREYPFTEGFPRLI